MLSSNCTVVVNVVRVPTPPTLSNTLLFVNELSVAGVFVGNVGAVPAVGDSLGPITIVNQSTPGAFAMDTLGNITVAAPGPLSPIGIHSQYTLNISAANSVGLTSYTTVSITVLAVPQPPTTFPQASMGCYSA